MDTSWFLSPNSSMCANRGMYKHGSATESNTIMSKPNIDLGNAVQRGCCARLASPQQTQAVLLGRSSTTEL